MKIDKAKFDMLCAERMLNATDVAKHSGVTYGTIYKSFKNDVRPSTIGKIAYVLCVSPSDLIVKE